MIKIILDNIVRLKVDCIVNAANHTLLGGGGVDHAIHFAAGPKLLEECKTLHGCETGKAKITKGYNLPAKYIIHAVGPVYHGLPEDIGKLRSCYEHALDLAKEYDIHSIAFPSISTGEYMFPVEIAAELALRTIKTWTEVWWSDYQIDITICCYTRKTYDVYLQKYKEVYSC